MRLILVNERSDKKKNDEELDKIAINEKRRKQNLIMIERKSSW